MYLNNLELLIAKGDLEEAINWLLTKKNSYNKDTFNQVLAVSSWHNRLTKKEIIGDETNQTDYQKIVNALIFLKKSIEEDQQQINHGNGDITIYERKLKVKLLEIPDLQVKIDTFETMCKFSGENEISLRFISNQRKININFKCSVYTKIAHLKDEVLSHFQFDQYIEYSSLININWRIFHFNKILDEDKTLADYDILNEDWIVIKLEVSLKFNNPGGGGGIIILDTQPV